jgi:prepilin peptidase CpaA
MNTRATRIQPSEFNLSRQRRLGWSIGLTLPPVVLITVAAMGSRGGVPDAAAAGIVLGLLLLAAAVCDVRTRRIPNWITYSGLFWALVLNVTGSISAGDSGMTGGLGVAVAPSLIGPRFLGTIGIGPSILGAAGCFVAMAVGTRGWTRAGGDTKLATVIGAFLGLQLGITAIAIGYILAGVLSAAGCVWKFGALRIGRGALAWVGHLLLPISVAPPDWEAGALRTITVPLGGYLALGVLSALFLVPGIRH